MEELRYAIALNCLRGVGPTAALQLYRHYGSARAVFETRHEVEGKLRTALADWNDALKRAEAELEFCQRHAIRVLPLAHEDYPALLRECNDPPLVLFYKGTADLNKIHIISVVGTRRISEYGKTICQKFCQELQDLLPDCLIVSGLAYGVDIHSHRAALANGLETVGVLAHGLDTIYPSLHRDTAKQMTTHGGLLTEYLTGTNADKGNFVRRNRIVAGIASATVIVESAAHGGALITADLAQGYGREVFAFPGRVGDQFSEGCNALIRDNKAALVTSAADVAHALRWVTETERPKAVQRQLFPDLSELQQRICTLLQTRDDFGINQIAIALNTPVKNIASDLSFMEMIGLVKLLPGGRYKLMR